MVRVKRWLVGFSPVLLILALVAAGCGGGSSKSTSTGTSAGGKGGTLMTVANAAPSGSPDPQVNYTLQEWQLLILSHDGLIAFRRVAGAPGTKKVADLAESIPKPTNGGKTWALQASPGDQVLRRLDARRRRRQGDVRAALQDRQQPQRGHLVQRHPGRRRVHQDAEDVRPFPGDQR